MQYSKDPLVDRSLRHSVRDGMATSAMAGAGETYLSAFALFLKASPHQVALLATLPALLGSLGQFLAAWLARRSSRRLPLILIGAGLQGLLWLPMLILPLAMPGQAVPLLLGVATLYHFCGHLAAPLWMSLMGDLVPDRRRGRFFGCRTRLTTIASFSSLVGGGLVLHLFDGAAWTRWGFAAIFLFAFGARMLSVYHLSRMHEPERAAAARERALGRDWLGAVKQSGALWFSLYVVLMQSGVGISGPLFSVYMLRELELSYLQFMAATGTAVLVQFLTLNTWGRIGDVFGNRLILRVTSMTVPFLPALWLVSDHFGWLLVVQVLSGMAWAGFSLSSGNLLYELVPSVQRATYAAFHNVMIAGGVFLGGMAGAALLHVLPAQSPWFADGDIVTPLLSVFLVSGLVRLGVAGVFLRRVKELRRPRRALSASAFVFRVTRFNAFVGLAYEFVGGFRRPVAPQPAPGQAAAPVAAAAEPAAP